MQVIHDWRPVSMEAHSLSHFFIVKSKKDQQCRLTVKQCSSAQLNVSRLSRIFCCGSQNQKQTKSSLTHKWLTQCFLKYNDWSASRLPSLEMELFCGALQSPDQLGKIQWGQKADDDPLTQTLLYCVNANTDTGRPNQPFQNAHFILKINCKKESKTSQQYWK